MIKPKSKHEEMLRRALALVRNTQEVQTRCIIAFSKDAEKETEGRYVSRGRLDAGKLEEVYAKHRLKAQARC